MAFFFEATFIGLWIFGWDKLPRGPAPRDASGSRRSAPWFSAYFILAANAFMQNPVGFQMAEDEGPRRDDRLRRGAHQPGRPRRVPAHASSASFMVAAGRHHHRSSAWHLARNQNLDTMRLVAAVRPVGMIVAFAGVATLFGDQLSLAMVATQPMKMAAAEAMYDTVCGADASFSIFTLGTPDGTSELFSIRVPYLLVVPLDAHASTAASRASTTCRRSTTELFGPRSTTRPIIWVTYWSFRWMIGLGARARPRRRRRPLAHAQEAGCRSSAGSGRSRSGASRSRSPR